MQRAKKHKQIITVVLLATLILLLLGVITLFTKQNAKDSDHSPVVKAFDTTAIITEQTWFDDAYTNGYRLYVLHSTKWGTCTPWEHTERQLGMALKAGIAVAAYTRDPRCWKSGIEATGSYRDKLSFFALDIETDPGIPATREMVNGIRSMGVAPVIYTGSAMWSSVQQNNENFSDIPLWDTDVRDDNFADWKVDLYHPRPVQYGGWNEKDTMRIGVQQYFEYELNGVRVDLNSFNSSILKSN